MLKTLMQAIRADQTPLIEDVWSQPMEKLIAERPLNLLAPEGFKLQIVSPTPKTRLKQALDAYERNNVGSPSSAPGSPNPSAPKNSSAAAAAQAAALLSSASRARQDSFSNISIDDSLSQLLLRLQLPQYVRVLKKQHIDVDVISCMEPNDLANFGISDPGHREIIVEAAVDGFDAVKGKIQGGGGGGGVSTVRSDTLASVESFDIGVAVASPESSKKKAVVTLSDSDDDDLPPPPAAKKNVVITLDSDDDDDLDLLPIAKAPVVAASPVPPTPEKVAIELSDDDDI